MLCKFFLLKSKHSNDYSKKTIFRRKHRTVDNRSLQDVFSQAKTTTCNRAHIYNTIQLLAYSDNVKNYTKRQRKRNHRKTFSTIHTKHYTVN